MPSWIETEAKTRLLNADQIVNIDLQKDDVLQGDNATQTDDLFCVRTYLADDSGYILISGLTHDQALEAMKHLSLWLPAATPRTLRMSDLAQSVKRQREGSQAT